MNDFFRQLLRIDPYAINKIPERFLNKADIEFAIEHDYNVNENTPTHLLKYHQIAYRFLKTYKNQIQSGAKKLTGQELIYLFEHKLIDYTFLNSTCINLSSYSATEKDTIIDYIKEIIEKDSYLNDAFFDLLKTSKELTIFYLKKHINSYSKLVEVFDDYEEIYQLVQDNLSSFKISEITFDLFEVWYKHDKSIILNKELNYSVTSNPKFVNYIKDSGYSALDFAGSSKTISRDTLVEYFINEDLSNIQYIATDLGYKSLEEIKKNFLANLPASIEYLSYYSAIIQEHSFNQSDIQNILDATKKANISFNNCSWFFISRDEDIVYQNIVNNPQSLNTWQNLDISILSKEQRDYIVSLVENKEIEISGMIRSFKSCRELYYAALKINPFIIENNTTNMDFDYPVDIIMEAGYKLSLQTPGGLFYYAPEYVYESLKYDISLINHPSFPAAKTDEDVELLFNILKSHNYQLTKNSPKPILENPLLIIEALRNKTLNLEDVRKISLNRNLNSIKELYEYLLSNYSPAELSPFYELQYERLYDFNLAEEKVIIDLKNGFKSCLNMSPNLKLSLEVQKHIYDLYLKNYEENKDYYDNSQFLQNNPYINLYECLHSHKPLLNIKSLPNNVKKYFIEHYEEYGVEIIPEYVSIFSYSSELKNVIEHNPNLIDYIEIYNYSELEDFIIECIEKGTYKLNKNSSKLPSKVLNYCIENNIKGLEYFFTLEEYRYEEKKRILIDLIKEKKVNARLIPNSAWKRFSPQEFYELLLINKDLRHCIYAASSEYNEFYRYENIQEEARRLSFRRNLQYTDEELKAQALQDVELLLNKKILSRITLTTEEWGRAHQELVNLYQIGIIPINNNYDYHIFFEKSPGIIDEELLDGIYNDNLIILATLFNSSLPTKYFELLEEKFKNLSQEYQNDILASLPNNLARHLIETNYSEIDRLYYAKYYTKEEVYEMWHNANIDLSVVEKIKIPYFEELIIELISKDYRYAKYTHINFSLYIKDEDFINQVFNIFIEHQDEINAYECELFYFNPKIAEYIRNNENYINKNFVINELTYDYMFDLDIETRDKYIEISLNNNPDSIIDIVDFGLIDYEKLRELIHNKKIVITEKNIPFFAHRSIFKDILDNYYDEVKNFFTDEILAKLKVEYIEEMAIKSNYVLTADSLLTYKKNKNIVLNSIKLNPSSIIYASYDIEFDENEQKNILDILLKNNIYFYPNAFLFLRENYDYLERSIANKPECIDYISISSLYLDDIVKLLLIVKQAILGNKYILNEKSPEWLLLDSDIRNLYISKYPEQASRYTDYSLLDSQNYPSRNPISILKELSKDITKIETISLPSSLVYPQDLMNTIIDKLISSHYIINNKTPDILFNYEKFVYYALINNSEIPSKYIESFITFENMYKYQNTLLFKRYMEQGYGKKYNAYIKKYGIDSTIRAAEKVGYLLFEIKISEIENIEDIQLILQKAFSQLNNNINIIDYLIRSEYEITDEEIKYGIYNPHYYNSRIYLNTNDNFFRYILKKDPSKIKLYKGDTTDIYELAFRYGYIITSDEYRNNEHFRKSLFISKKILDFDLDNIYYYEGKNEELYEYAINIKGYIPDYNRVMKVSSMCESSTIIRKGMEENIEFAFLYQGTARSMLDIFSIVDKNGLRITPTKENIKRLTFLFKSDELFIQILDYDVSNIVYYQGMNEEIYKYAIEKGYIPNIEDLKNNEYLQQSPTIIRKAMFEDINSVIYFKGNALDISDLFEYQDKNGNKFIPTLENIENLKIIHNIDELMKKAIIYNPQNIVFYVGSNEELFQLALNNGYVPRIEDFNYSLKLCQSNTMYEYIIRERKTELIPILVYYSGNDDKLIENIYRLLLKDKYDKIIQTPLDATNYASIWKSFSGKEDHQNLLAYMNVENIEAFTHMKMDYYLVLKYGLKNSKMIEYINIINNHQTKEFSEFYNHIISNYIEFNNNSFGVDLFLKLACVFNHYPELAKSIQNTKLTDADVANLIRIINSNYLPNNITRVEELSNLDLIQKEELYNLLSSNVSNPDIIKDAILKYVFDLSYKDFKDILERYINYDTLDKIISKCTDHNSELYVEANMLKTMLIMLEETINATNNIDDLKNLLKNYMDNHTLVNRVRSLFYDIKERIRNIYELDANISLTDLTDPSLPRRKSASGDEIIELENSEYVIYAHVADYNETFTDYVNYRFNGKVTICVSPISNIGKKLYSTSGVILGFSTIPRGGFIGSSNRNMASNSYIYPNDYEVHKDHYYHLEIRDSSSLTPENHPETLLYRDGLLPSCIIIRGEEPSKQELEIREVLSKAIREKLHLGDDYLLPLVHTQAIGNVAELKENEEISIVESDKAPTTTEVIDADVDLGAYQARISRLEEIRRDITKLREQIESLKITKSPVYDIIPMRIGGSHDMFKCHLVDREGIYYLKPGYRKDGASIDPYRSYAMEAAYKIQSIVNPESAVYSATIEVPKVDLGIQSEGNVLCSVIEVIPDTTSYQGWSSSATYKPLSEREMSFFIQEFISDYLLFSYDTKGENFLKDKKGIPYGIDKEQALKFIIHPSFVSRDTNGDIVSYDTSMETSMKFNPNGCRIIYQNIFENVRTGNQDLSEIIYNKGLQAIERIENIPDEEYVKIFKNYVEDFSKSSVVQSNKNKYMENGLTEEEALEYVKKELYASLLARKNNLRKEFLTYFNNLIIESYKSQGKEEPEWIKKQQMSM